MPAGAKVLQRHDYKLLQSLGLGVQNSVKISMYKEVHRNDEQPPDLKGTHVQDVC